MSTLAVNTITNAAGGNTAQINGMTPTADSLQGFRNRIINGNMVIDQRNAGASLTPTDGAYSLDRWQALAAVASKYTIQQNAGAVTPPAGFTNYLGVTSLSAYSVGSSEYFGLRQSIEGFNTSDLGWGTASAQAVTLSFWVRSSLTGNFGGALQNNAQNRFYAFQYTISAANTWEQKTVTIPGDTSGTWTTDNTAGVRLTFGLGVGSALSIAAGAWGSTLGFSVTGSVSVVGTSGATFYITGVQLEVGSVATPFERRDYGRELIMCQRYYEGGFAANYGVCTNGIGFGVPVAFKVEKRATPTVVSTSVSSNIGSASASAAIISTFSYAYLFVANATGAGQVQISYTASAEL